MLFVLRDFDEGGLVDLRAEVDERLISSALVLTTKLMRDTTTHTSELVSTADVSPISRMPTVIASARSCARGINGS